MEEGVIPVQPTRMDPNSIVSSPTNQERPRKRRQPQERKPSLPRPTYDQNGKIEIRGPLVVDVVG